jgi:hypothetical protein
MRLSRIELATLAVFATVWLDVQPSKAQQQLPRPGAGLPTFEAPPAPEGVHEKTDALMKSVGGDQPGVLATTVTTRRATIQSVDPATRMVTLVDDNGIRSEKKAAPDLDLTQVKSGDRVTVKEIASVAVFIQPRATASPPAERNVVVEHAEPGETPARLTVETEEIAATVESIEFATRWVVLRNPDGTSRTIQADPRVDLEKIHIGDQVTLRLTKAVALQLEPAE